MGHPPSVKQGAPGTILLDERLAVPIWRYIYGGLGTEGGYSEQWWGGRRKSQEQMETSTFPRLIQDWYSPALHPLSGAQAHRQ